MILPVQKTKALVLGYHPLGEADKIISFLTKDFGYIRAVGKGARRIKNKLCGRLEIMTYGDLVFYERTDKDLHIINTFDIIEHFQELRENLTKIAYCSYLAELIQQIETPGVQNTEIFNLLLNIMVMMRGQDDPELLARIFELRLLASAGLSPKLDSCVLCTSYITPGNSESLSVKGVTGLRFSVADGGILCCDCGNNFSQQKNRTQTIGAVITISRGTLELMKRLQNAPLELLARLKMLDSSRAEIRRITRNFISYHMDRGKFRSLDFLESIEKDDLETIKQV
ncbi:DNA repair protein RecO [Candidatus Poribacteria bacterium]|nr:DNA repair protein RecO [Candidatus Poribacteria bacterium]